MVPNTYISKFGEQKGNLNAQENTLQWQVLCKCYYMIKIYRTHTHTHTQTQKKLLHLYRL